MAPAMARLLDSVVSRDPALGAIAAASSHPEGGWSRAGWQSPAPATLGWELESVKYYLYALICRTPSVSPARALDLCSRIPVLQMHFQGKLQQPLTWKGLFSTPSDARWFFSAALSQGDLEGRQASPVRFSHTRSMVWSQTVKFSKYFNERVSDFFINF